MVEREGDSTSNIRGGPKGTNFAGLSGLLPLRFRQFTAATFVAQLSISTS